MNQQQDSRDQPFEEIRILGLEPAEDVVEPGRSVFGGESSTEDLPHWTEPPTAPVAAPSSGFAAEEPRWADDVPEHHESQHPVGALDEPTAAAFFDDPSSGHALASQGQVEREGTGSDAFDLVRRGVGEFHDRARAEGLLNLSDGVVEHACGGLRGGFLPCLGLSHGVLTPLSRGAARFHRNVGTQ